MANPECPVHHGFKDVRQVPVQPGYDPKLEHWCCDWCKIGWYQYPVQSKKHFTGTAAGARAAYVPPKQVKAKLRS